MAINRSKKRRIRGQLALIVASTICLLSACNTKRVAEFSIPEVTAIYGLATPIRLDTGFTLLPLQDYFPEKPRIDSFDAPGLQIEYLDSLYALRLSQESDSHHLFNLNCYIGRNYYSIPTYATNRKKVPFECILDQRGIDSAFIAGDFNNWTAQQSPLQKAGTAWNTDLWLKPGEYAYQIKWFIGNDEQQEPDPGNPISRENGMGGTNSILKFDAPPESKLPRIRTQKDSAGKIYFESSLPLTKVYAYWENHLIPAVSINDQEFFLNIPEISIKKDRSFIRVFASGIWGRSNQLLLPLAAGKLITDAASIQREDWEAAVLYFPLIDRFYNGFEENDFEIKDPQVLPKADYKGGDLQGILKKIKEGFFSDLGINTIWLSPITQNPTSAWGHFKDPDTRFSGYHGYWPVTSTTIDWRFGDSATLAQLIEEAHRRNINVILDYVANHVHLEHNIYSQHPNWATSLYLPDGSMNTQKWDEHRLTTWFDTFLPTLDLENQKVTEFMVDSAVYWLSNFELDGFRHDATKHIPLNFWRTLNKRLKTRVGMPQEKRLYQIGETYGSHELIGSYLGSGLIDAQFDFNMYDQCLPVFSGNDPDMLRLSNALKASIAEYGNHHLMGNISGNQDKPRFISYADGNLKANIHWEEYKRIGWKEDIGIKDSSALNKLAMLHAWNCAIPGVPVIYYGDEIGMPGAGDPDNRRMMNFSGLSAVQESLQNEVKSLIQFRRNKLPLIYGETRILFEDKHYLLLEREYLNEKVLILFVLDGSVDLNLPNPEGYHLIETIGSPTAKIQIDKRIFIEQNQSWSYNYFYLKKNTPK